MKLKKWLISAVVLVGMTAVFVPAASAASIPTDGTGTVVENTTADSSSREFFTIKTADGNVFYIVVDKTKTDDNVYLLTPVTEDSLKALAESAAQKDSAATTSGTSGIFGSQSGSTGTSSTTGTSTSSATGSGASSSGSTAKPKTVASAGNIAFLALVAIAVFAAAFYFKIYKPKHARVPESFDDEPEERDERYGNSDEDEDGEDENEPEEPEKPKKAASAQRKPVKTNQSAPEQAQPDPAWESSKEQPETEEPDPTEQEPHAPAAPRPRREDVWPENGHTISEPEPAAQPEQPVNRSLRTQNGGLFAPDEVEEPEEPEPEDEENIQDYEDGMGLFDNPDQED